MKKSLLILIMTSTAHYSYAQNSNPWPTNGNVGIGTNNPQTTLTINGEVTLYTTNPTGVPVLRFNNYYNPMSMTDVAYVNAYAGRIGFHEGAGEMQFQTSSNPGTTGGTINMPVRMRITASGNVGIGSTMPDEKLSVQGTIHSQAVRVDMNSWSDNVFYSNYQLLPLSYVNSYIQKYRHLPDIPTEQEVLEKGIDLGELTRLLLKKLEESTLYIIQKDKELKLVQEQLDMQANQIRQLQKHIPKK